MKTHTAFIDVQRLARQFKVGDSVIITSHTGGIKNTPLIGRVTAVLSSIGFVDVQTPSGNARISPEDLVLDNSIDTSYLLDTSEQTWERRRALRIAKRYETTRLYPLIRVAREELNQGVPEVVAYDRMFRKHSSDFSDDEIKTSVVLASIFNKEALYWKSQGRMYSPTRCELETGIFTCPKCKSNLIKTNYRLHQSLHVCPECSWSICPEDIVMDDPREDCEEPLSLPLYHKG